MTATAVLPFGTAVHYHGSLQQLHGPATYAGRCEPCRYCHDTEGARHVLHVVTASGTRDLCCVRAESFTVLCPWCEQPDCPDRWEHDRLHRGDESTWRRARVAAAVLTPDDPALPGGTP